MRREERLAAARDAERALQLGAGGDERPRRGDRQRQRRRARSRASGGSGTPARTTESSQRRWIGRSWREERVGDAAEPLARVVVVEGDRLVGAVAARQHERPRRGRAQSRWWSGVYGSITPSQGEPGATDGGDGRVRAPAERARSAAPRERSSARSSAASSRERVRRRRSSARTASPRGACARAAARPPSSSPRRRRGGSRRAP